MSATFPRPADFDDAAVVASKTKMESALAALENERARKEDFLNNSDPKNTDMVEEINQFDDLIKKYHTVFSMARQQMNYVTFLKEMRTSLDISYTFSSDPTKFQQLIDRCNKLRLAEHHLPNETQNYQRLCCLAKIRYKLDCFRACAMVVQDLVALREKFPNSDIESEIKSHSYELNDSVRSFISTLG